MPSGVKRHPPRVEGRTMTRDLIDRAFRKQLAEAMKTLGVPKSRGGPTSRRGKRAQGAWNRLTAAWRERDKC